MEFLVIDFLSLLGSLGLFIFGMKIMSEGIQKFSGPSLRRALDKISDKKLKGIFTGIYITGLVQSSSATTVMMVSSVNAGILSLTEAISVVMGANIGTTVTAWLISILGFKIKIAAFSLPVIAVGMPLMFFKKDSLKFIGEALIGFSLLFLGLDFLIQNIPDPGIYPELSHYLSFLLQPGVFTTILFIGTGVLLTVIVQSSSAAIALTLTLLYKGIIPFETAAALVLGENIGTTIIANLAAINTNIHAKRVARAHLIFNVFGAIWAIIFFTHFISFIRISWEPFQQFLQNVDADFLQNKEVLQLSLFHSAFNILTAGILVPFISYLSNLIVKLVEPKKGEEDGYHLEYINSGILNTAELAMLEVKKEVGKFGNLILKMHGFIKRLITERKTDQFYKLKDRIKRYEEITDRIEVEVIKYLAEISKGEVSEAASKDIRVLLAIVGDLEAIADIYFRMSAAIEKKRDKKIWFTPEQRNALFELHKMVEDNLINMIENIGRDTHQIDIKKAIELEEKVNSFRDEMRRKHLEDIEKGEYTFESGIIYSDLFNQLEKIGDHVFNINEVLSGMDLNN